MAAKQVTLALNECQARVHSIAAHAGQLLLSVRNRHNLPYLLMLHLHTRYDLGHRVHCMVFGYMHAGLTLMHLVWAREHNRQAAKLEATNPSWTDEMLFQHARAITIAKYQRIVYEQVIGWMVPIARSKTEFSTLTRVCTQVQLLLPLHRVNRYI
jgi:hypothetical protein